MKMRPWIIGVLSASRFQYRNTKVMFGVGTSADGSRVRPGQEVRERNSEGTESTDAI